MSFTGQPATVTSGIAAEGRVAARDIIRPDALGRSTVVVPKGMAVPPRLAVEPDEVTSTPAPVQATPADPEYLRRPEPDIGGQQRASTRVARQIWAYTRRGPE